MRLATPHIQKQHLTASEFGNDEGLWGELGMRWVVLIAAVALTSCENQTLDSADEAMAEAERANSRASDLEDQVKTLRSDLEREIADRRAATEDLEAEVRRLESRMPY